MHMKEKLKIILFNSVSVPQEKATGSHCEVHKSRLSEALCALISLTAEQSLTLMDMSGFW